MVTGRRGCGRAHPDAGEGLVHVNVGGLRHSLRCSTLNKFPDTRLGKLLECRSEEDILQVCDDYDVQQKEFYFDRNPGLFPYVLHFYQTGKLHVMEELCVFSFSQEMEYWGIEEFFLDSCCSFRYHERKLGTRRRISWDGDSDDGCAGGHADICRLRTELQHFAEVRYGGARQRLWLTLENPGYSLPSKLFSVASVGVVLASLTVMCVKSLPEYQTFDQDRNLIEEPAVDVVEALSTCWFTLEVVLRFLLAPNRKQFLRQPLNVIDVASVFPVYVTLICDWALGAQSELGDLGRVLQVPLFLLTLGIRVSHTNDSHLPFEYQPSLQTFDQDRNLIEEPAVDVVEALSTCWFTLEVVLRFLLAPNRKQFLRQPLNVIDVASVFPVYVTLICDWALGAQSELGDLGRVLQVLRLMRIFRVLKLARHSTGLRSLGATLRHSYREVGILLLYLAVGVSVFSGMAYTAECQQDTGLDTIPACWWWGTVSMTTVGYGDVVPVTAAGRLAAGGCILGGTLVVALPITLIFNKFSHFYRRQKALEAAVRNRHPGEDGRGAMLSDGHGEWTATCPR
ncbi:potassium voltage-gated channel subfamily S member 1-like [Hippocampus comes]|uniref:potassium voltage-gated channel subfamily S member 1-like n=1 Tax=Hippocampus comes TaxID=109280 RepID=UPI00094EFB2A|nr:PREDICTED: potassium voltage-gated channel subfamily S member 1-like [Hippocampus comes]